MNGPGPQPTTTRVKITHCQARIVHSGNNIRGEKFGVRVSVDSDAFGEQFNPAIAVAAQYRRHHRGR